MSWPGATRLVVGLGNPGDQYASTRHNVGFRVVRALAGRLRVTVAEPRFAGRFAQATLPALAGDPAVRVGLLEPWTWMNRSGEAVVLTCEALGQASGLPLAPADCLVVYDDLDLPFGRIRLRAGGGAGGHNGIADVIRRLGTRDVPRLRFGISRPAPGVEPIDHVLGNFSRAEEGALSAPIERSVDALLCWLRHGIAASMSEFNDAASARNEEPEGPP